MKTTTLLLILVGLQFSAVASTITAIASGNWTNNAVWSCSCQPTKNDNVIIPSGITIKIPALTTIDLTTGPVINISVSGTLTMNGVLNLDKTDVMTINSGGTVNSTLIWPFAGDVNSGGTDIFISPLAPVTGLAYITNSTLPITLTSFESEILGNSVLLKWISQSEENFNYYSVERSQDGTTFTSIAEVKGAGNSTTSLSYSWEDKNPIPGKSYYRLKAIDMDESEQAFKIIMVQFTATQKDVAVYPNPVVDGKFTLQLNFTPTDQDVFVIHSADGKTVYQKSLTASDTMVVLPENSVGNYFVEVITTKEKLYKHVIVQ
jgi:hypothetical protein